MKEGVLRVVKTYVCRAARAARLMDPAREVAILREDHLVSRRLQGDVGDAAALRAVQIT
jgi:hypothetical protein